MCGQPIFFYDLASAWCYIAAEQVNHGLGTVPVWQPVSMAELAPEAHARLAPDPEAERAAADRGLMPIRWPDPYPTDTHTAMLMCAFAKKAGRAVAFSLAAFRQAFAAGRDIGQTDNALIAAAACELHPRAVIAGLTTRAVEEELAGGTEQARELGVTDLPAIAVDGTVVSGRAAATLTPTDL